MTTATQFIAHDDNLIWGVGPTAEAAMAAALEMSSEIVGLKTNECTPELAADVKSSGGDVSFGRLPDGRMGTGDQKYDAA